MSTRVDASVRIDAAGRELLRQWLALPLGATVELDQLNMITNSERIDVQSLQAGVSDGPVCTTLSTLAPESFDRARDLLAGVRLASLGPHGLAMPVQIFGRAHAQLVDAVAAASARIASAIRDITGEVFADASAGLGYEALIHRGSVATGIELRHESELVLLRIYDGGALEADHAGLLDAICEDRQIELEQAAARLGITLTDRRQQYYEPGHPESLISAAVSRGEASLACATVLDAEAPVWRPRVLRAL